MIRLDRLLSNLGYCSRGDVNRFLRTHKVEVSGQGPVRANTKVDHASVTIDGEPLDPPAGIVIMMNKPLGYTCSHKDSGALVYELLPERWCRRSPALSTIGRLDKETSGLLLFTDDGSVIHRLTSPRHDIGKVYRVGLARPLKGDEAQIFSSGTLMLENEDSPLKPAELQALSETEALLTIREGRYHQVRRMFAAVGNHVETLHRESIGSLKLDVPDGQFRLLDASEIKLAETGGR